MGVLLEVNQLQSEIRYFDDAFRDKVQPGPLGFLRQLNGLSVFDLKGKDPTRTRVVTTLIHGNEPSGFIGCHHWLCHDFIPATNIRIIFCNPEAALTKPIFSHRYLEHGEDLNRYFSSDETLNSNVANRARQIKQMINQVNPEAVIDLHNTSGDSGAFGVALSENDKTLDLVSLFSNKLILTGLHVGAIMEQRFNAPLATIECGGANEASSHQVAIAGLNDFFCRDDIFDHHADRVEVHRHPIRVELMEDVSLGFSHNYLPTTDITLRADIEKLNRQRTSAGEFMGWYDSSQSLPLQAIDEQGIEQIEQLFEKKNGCLFAKQNMQLFMVTTSLEIATNDCLFYITLEAE